MASLRKSKSNNLVTRAEQVLRGQIRSGDHLMAALSGGVDSIVLLDLLAALSVPMQFSLSAVHVDHGISTNAGKWSKFCRAFCKSRSIPIKIVSLKITREPGISLEAAARDARYRVFEKLKADYVVLAQHLDDQAETLMLQLLRGAGVKGLGAMPVVRNQLPSLPRAGESWREGGRKSESPQILRPLLECRAAKSRPTPGKTNCTGSATKAMRMWLSTAIFCVMQSCRCWSNVFLPIAAHSCAPAVIWRKHPACWMSWPKPTAEA